MNLDTPQWLIDDDDPIPLKSHHSHFPPRLSLSHPTSEPETEEFPLTPTMMMAVIGIVRQKNKEETRKAEDRDETTASELKRWNEELEEEVRRSKEREQILRRQLQSVWERIRVAEDAEERLCSQLADLEADSLQQARHYHARILSLMDQLSLDRSLLNSSSIPLPSSS